MTQDTAGAIILLNKELEHTVSQAVFHMET